MWKLGWLALGCTILLLGCANRDEDRAKQLYDRAMDYVGDDDYDTAIKILQQIRINFENTKHAPIAENQIEQLQGLQRIYIDNMRRSINTSFSRIGRALENYKVRFLAYPLTPKDLDKLPAVVIPEWDDDWGHPIYYKPLYSQPEVPRHTPDGYVLASFGRDGLPGGTGLNQDRFFQNGKEVEQILAE